MSLKLVHGNLLEARVEALVNAVNTVGVMGKGLALSFKQRFPENFYTYAAACKRGEVQVGKMLVTELSPPSAARWIVNFPTKQHWRAPSKLEWVESGLAALRFWMVENAVRSIAVPALGCGLGGLAWAEVLPLIHSHLGDLEQVEVLVFEPAQKSP